MFDLGAHRGLAAIGLLVRFGQRPVLVGPLVGEVARPGCAVLESFALPLSSVGAVAIEPRLLTMQQVRQLMAVVDVSRGNAGAMHQTAVTVRSDERRAIKTLLRP